MKYLKKSAIITKDLLLKFKILLWEIKSIIPIYSTVPAQNIFEYIFTDLYILTIFSNILNFAIFIK
jgi:hypothetical protein